MLYLDRRTGDVHSEIVEVDSVTLVANGKKLALKLLDSIDFSVRVVNKSASCAFKTANKSAKSVILNLKAEGLVLKIPLLLKCCGKRGYSLARLYVILVCKTEKLSLIACKICLACTHTELVFYREDIAKLCHSCEKISVLTALLCHGVKCLCLFLVLFTAALGYRVIEEAAEGIGVKHML